MAFQIVRSICTACGDCLPLCPTKSISPFKGTYKIDAETCTECVGRTRLAPVHQCLHGG
jgi:ferredoxin